MHSPLLRAPFSYPIAQQRFFKQRIFVMVRKRLLDVPSHGSRAWRLPAIVFWLRHRREQMLADRGEHYLDDSAWKRRLTAINYRIDAVEAEMASLFPQSVDERKAA
jgi:hypothetical protein